MLHKETHSFEKGGKAYRLTATVRPRNGAFYIALNVADTEPIISEYEHVHTGEPVKVVDYETWSLETDAFYHLDEAKEWTAVSLPRIIEQFNSGKNPRWEQEY